MIRIGDVHVCFYIYSWEHLICLIALFGNIWFAFASWAPQSSTADTGVQFDRHGCVVATGSDGPSLTPDTHSLIPRLCVPWPDRLALSPTLGMAHATDEGKEPGVHYSDRMGRDTMASATRTLAAQKAAPAAAAKKAGATELDPGRAKRVQGRHYHKPDGSKYKAKASLDLRLILDADGKVPGLPSKKRKLDDITIEGMLPTGKAGRTFGAFYRKDNGDIVKCQNRFGDCKLWILASG